MILFAAESKEIQIKTALTVINILDCNVLAQVTGETNGIEIKTEDTEVKPEKEGVETEHVAARQLENQNIIRIKTEHKPPFKNELAEVVNPNTRGTKPVLEELKDCQFNLSSIRFDKKFINTNKKVSEYIFNFSQQLALTKCIMLLYNRNFNTSCKYMLMMGCNGMALFLRKASL